jgi:hypothetical protein
MSPTEQQIYTDRKLSNNEIDSGGNSYSLFEKNPFDNFAMTAPQQDRKMVFENSTTTPLR